MYTVCMYVCVCVCVQVFSEAVTAAVAYKHKSTDFLDQVMQELEVTYMFKNMYILGLVFGVIGGFITPAFSFILS